VVVVMVLCMNQIPNLNVFIYDVGRHDWCFDEARLRRYRNSNLPRIVVPWVNT
jgi:hypothetical protein